MSNKSPQNNYNQYRIRQVGVTKGEYVQYGITIPKKLIEFYPVGTKFSIEWTEYGFKCISGADIKQLKKEAEEINLEYL